MNTNIQLDAGMLTSIAIFVAVFVVILFAWPRRAQLAAISTPYIDALTGKVVGWLIGIGALLMILTPLVNAIGLRGQIVTLSAESLMHLAFALAAITWVRKQ